jgi:hypothetical protein
MSILVSAAPGYGKATLLVLSRDRDERQFAWVSLDAADNDPVARRCARSPASMWREMPAPQPSHDEWLVHLVVDDVGRVAVGLALIESESESATNPENVRRQSRGVGGERLRPPASLEQTAPRMIARVRRYRL